MLLVRWHTHIAFSRFQQYYYCTTVMSINSTVQVKRTQGTTVEKQIWYELWYKVYS